MSEQIVSRRTYVQVFIVLVVLAGVTALAAEVNLGPFNVTVAMAIALVKAGLVAFYFMHLRESRRLIGLVVLVSILWLGILIVLTSADYATRDWTTPPIGY